MSFWDDSLLDEAIHDEKYELARCILLWRQSRLLERIHEDLLKERPVKIVLEPRG